MRRQVGMIRRWADEGVYDRSVEARQRAIRDLEAICAADSSSGEPWMLLGRIFLIGEFDSRARSCFRKATSLMPGEAGPWLALGRAWKREWIRGVDTLAARRAEEAFDTASAVRPHASEAWIALVPLRYGRGDLAGAMRAAERARAARRNDPEAALALAFISYRSGDIERADTLFREALPRLRADLRALMLDAPSWFRGAIRQPRPARRAQGAISAPDEPAGETPERAGVQERASSAASIDSSAAFWRRNDPDPTTGANEMQLEYWSRVAHAWFVFWDPDRPHLDARAETFVRYGAPARVLNNPPDVPLTFAPLRAGPNRRIGSALEYPMHVQGWYYPELGMRVVLNDRSLHGRFTPQVTRDFDPLGAPSPEVLARRSDLVTFGDGVAVFPTLPPSHQRIELRGTTIRFEGERGPRMLIQVRAEGRPDDRMTARWLVLDRDGRELAGAPVHLGVSSCDPAAWRLAEIAAELPAGAADVTVSVRDARGRRGLFRTASRLETPTTSLAISDVVLCCGDPGALARTGLVQFEADMERRVAGRGPLAVYFEIYRLAPGGDGLSRFEYEYRIRRLAGPGGKAPRGEPPVVLSARREESNAGPLRRQFVSVPIASLPPGPYRLEVIVRDPNAGTEVSSSTEFARE